MKNKQVSQEIRYKIMSGEYPLHGTIPPERELTQIFGVSRVTIRSALQRLVEEGVLERMVTLDTPNICVNSLSGGMVP